MKINKKVIQIGNSLGIVIDRVINSSLKVKKDDILEIECEENKILISKKRGK